MIYTVTFNPALDYAMGVKKLEPGMTNRSYFEQLLPGGKGLNVSAILTHLGIENTALGFIAGFTGKEIKRRFEEAGGHSDFIELKNGVSRINVKIKSDTETEINASGPDIDAGSLDKLMEQLDSASNGDTVVISGSIPPSLPDSLYSDILKRLDGKGIMCVVDATRELLMNVLCYRPFLIKPNNHELGEIFGVTLSTREEVVPYAEKLAERGARNVLVSMAGEGAVLVAESGEVIKAPAPKGTVKNSVGAGDSMVAGFIAGWHESHSAEHAFKMGVAAGSASAFSEELATKEEIMRLYDRL